MKGRQKEGKEEENYIYMEKRRRNMGKAISVSFMRLHRGGDRAVRDSDGWRKGGHDHSTCILSCMPAYSFMHSDSVFQCLPFLPVTTYTCLENLVKRALYCLCSLPVVWAHGIQRRSQAVGQTRKEEREGAADRGDDMTCRQWQMPMLSF